MTLTHAHLTHILNQIVESLDVPDVWKGNGDGRKDVEEEFFSWCPTLTPYIRPFDISLNDVITWLTTALAVQKDKHHFCRYVVDAYKAVNVEQLVDSPDLCRYEVHLNQRTQTLIGVAGRECCVKLMAVCNRQVRQHMAELIAIQYGEQTCRLFMVRHFPVKEWFHVVEAPRMLLQVWSDGVQL